MLIGDSLNKNNAYKILNIRSDERNIMSAFKDNAHIDEASEAKDILMDTNERVFHDFFLYDDNALKKLNIDVSGVKNCIGENGILVTKFSRHQRSSLSDEWHQLFRDSRLNVDIAHSLAILWYHWANFEEERNFKMLEDLKKYSVAVDFQINRRNILKALKKAEKKECADKYLDCVHKNNCKYSDDCASSAPDSIKMWENVIMYLGRVWADKKFWNSRYNNSEDAMLYIKDRLQKKTFDAEIKGKAIKYANLIASKDNKFYGMFSKTRKLSDDIEKAGYKTLEDIIFWGSSKLSERTNLTDANKIYEDAIKYFIKNQPFDRQFENIIALAYSEFLTADCIAKNIGGNLLAGTMLLKNLKLLESAREMVERSIKLTDDHARKHMLKELRKAISPYVDASVMLTIGDTQKAVVAIEGLKDKKINLDEAIEIKMRAYYYYGRKLISSNSNTNFTAPQALEAYDMALHQKDLIKQSVSLSSTHVNMIDSLFLEIADNMVEKATNASDKLRKQYPDLADKILKQAHDILIKHKLPEKAKLMMAKKAPQKTILDISNKSTQIDSTQADYDINNVDRETNIIIKKVSFLIDNYSRHFDPYELERVFVKMKIIQVTKIALPEFIDEIVSFFYSPIAQTIASFKDDEVINKNVFQDQQADEDLFLIASILNSKNTPPLYQDIKLHMQINAMLDIIEDNFKTSASKVKSQKY